MESSRYKIFQIIISNSLFQTPTVSSRLFHSMLQLEWLGRRPISTTSTISDNPVRWPYIPVSKARVPLDWTETPFKARGLNVWQISCTNSQLSFNQIGSIILSQQDHDVNIDGTNDWDTPETLHDTSVFTVN